MNNTFSIKRIGLMYRQFYFLHNKKLLITVGATIGLIIVVHTFAHVVNFNHLNQINKAYFLILFILSFLGATFLWTGYAFPAFRTKEKCLSYLLIPTSTAEKFTFELINRLIVLVIVFPVIYWTFTNLVSWSFHQYVPEYENYYFSYSFYLEDFSTRITVLIVSLSLLIFTASFTGASYFRNLPIVKTILFIFILICVYAGFIYLVVEKMGLDQYNPKNGRVLFLHNANEGIMAGIITSAIVNIYLLIISFFRLKEKEV